MWILGDTFLNHGMFARIGHPHSESEHFLFTIEHINYSLRKQAPEPCTRLLWLLATVGCRHFLCMWSYSRRRAGVLSRVSKRCLGTLKLKGDLDLKLICSSVLCLTFLAPEWITVGWGALSTTTSWGIGFSRALIVSKALWDLPLQGLNCSHPHTVGVHWSVHVFCCEERQAIVQLLIQQCFLGVCTCQALFWKWRSQCGTKHSSWHEASFLVGDPENEQVNKFRVSFLTLRSTVETIKQDRIGSPPLEMGIRAPSPGS